MVEEYREREDKYQVEASWLMPALTDFTPPGGRIDERTVRLASRYLDTEDRSLLEHRVTLRIRHGELDSGWQLKLPDGTGRTELRLPAGGAVAGDSNAQPPAELAELVLGLCAGRSLITVATLHTERRLSRLLDADGGLVAEVADDLVLATVPGSPEQRWREVEVELGSGDERLLAEIGALLTGAGARPAEAASKLGRALGVLRVGPPDRPARRLGELVASYLDAQFRALTAGDLQLRRGGHPIHSTRVATRRYRSVLRVFAKLFQADRRDALDTELAWYAGLLGEVRDREVLRGRLAEAVRELPAELVLGPVAAAIDEQLGAEQAAARAELARELAGDRYLALQAELTAWHRQPPFTAAADRSAGRVRRYLQRAERAMDKRLRAAQRAAAQAGLSHEEALTQGSADERLHRARKAAKRARYTGELARPRLGEPASRLVSAATALQDQLGAHQDGVVASESLLRLGAMAGGRPGENGFTYGLLYARLLYRARPELAFDPDPDEPAGSIH
ncbi:MAG: CYTH and CHAD domain-containing protein [Jatrophihabitantaceae bacterium]